MAKGHARYCGLVRGPHVEKITVSGKATCLIYSGIFTVCTQFTNAASGRGVGTHALGVVLVASRCIVSYPYA
jgi:hypothetical protein